MKIKFNWGTGILIVIIIFLITVAFRIYLSTQIEVDLVTPEYYKKEVEYEKHIQKMRNSDALDQKVIFKEDSDSLIFLFPVVFKDKLMNGLITFYCPANVDKDLRFKLKLDEYFMQKFDKSEFTETRYIIKVDWYADSTGYYQEFEFIND